ncbi:SDR family NAD(P)-dependent oxidoreductase [Streptomyces polygonati]|uniref:NADP-dependent 3-hydroxy acid dehydrogenase YdfG n=1 Tax=Streptomyces polygonati TaxID=1617087 RepID=A0ABV8HFQ7_9ACTN
MSGNGSKTAVVTGVSSRFGAAYARRLAERGHDLILVGRNEGRIKSAMADVIEHSGVDVQILVADLGNAAQLAKVEERLRADESVDMLVNAAGAAKFAPSPGFDPKATDEQIALNVTAPTRLSVAALSGMARRGRGTIINVSSAMAFWIQPVSSVYSATKSYVLTFTQALQQELAGSGVTIQAVIPGAMSTGFWDGSGVELSTFPDENVMSPEDAVDAALAGLDAGEAVTIPSLVNISDWQAFERARDTLSPILSRAVPADRYVH